MTWWMWLALVVASLLVLAALGWRLFTRVRALFREVGAASKRVADTQRTAETTFDAWLVERAAQDQAFLDSLEPVGQDRRPAGRTMTATDPKG